MSRRQSKRSSTSTHEGPVDTSKEDTVETADSDLPRDASSRRLVPTEIAAREDFARLEDIIKTYSAHSPTLGKRGWQTLNLQNHSAARKSLYLIIAQLPLFVNVSNYAIKEFARVLTVYLLSDHAWLYRQGEHHDSAYIVLAGRVTKTTKLPQLGGQTPSHHHGSIMHGSGTPSHSPSHIHPHQQQYNSHALYHTEEATFGAILGKDDATAQESARAHGECVVAKCSSEKLQPSALQQLHRRGYQRALQQQERREIEAQRRREALQKATGVMGIHAGLAVQEGSPKAQHGLSQDRLLRVSAEDMDDTLSDRSSEADAKDRPTQHDVADSTWRMEGTGRFAIRLNNPLLAKKYCTFRASNEAGARLCIHEDNVNERVRVLNSAWGKLSQDIGLNYRAGETSATGAAEREPHRVSGHDRRPHSPFVRVPGHRPQLEPMVDFLAASPLFSGLRRRVLMDTSEAFKDEGTNAGVILAKQGEKPIVPAVFALRDGVIKVLRTLEIASATRWPSTKKIALKTARERRKVTKLTTVEVCELRARKWWGQVDPGPTREYQFTLVTKTECTVCRAQRANLRIMLDVDTLANIQRFIDDTFPDDAQIRAKSRDTEEWRTFRTHQIQNIRDTCEASTLKDYFARPVALKTLPRQVASLKSLQKEAFEHPELEKELQEVTTEELSLVPQRPIFLPSLQPPRQQVRHTHLSFLASQRSRPATRMSAPAGERQLHLAGLFASHFTSTRGQLTAATSFAGGREH
ncbi:unnamed protein product [Vitrella brassicaformis CCMP3155]|uniref:Cyclic nucleotide-binding domain-containing protein n=2 Tax=Vitrella brassicaformis TaxID=1169539 RepID=A0A0G4EDU7_VITBC|nr:unnamed protein product [Vitrella brassicaformis CCMP3155]|eukprot:CEL93713.1 unnamed protein product [Vitrella brassicaformis CCMP3155]